MRDATDKIYDITEKFIFQSTRPMRDATVQNDEGGIDLDISIHASHAGRDFTKVALKLFN